MTAVRVVLADDHPMFRYGLRAVLAAADDVEVVGEAANGDELVALVEQQRPDVVLTDLAMPGLSGVDAPRRILSRYPSTGVLVLTMHEDDEAVFGALRAGAPGYLLKGADRAEIVRAVLAVASGRGRLRRPGRPPHRRLLHPRTRALHRPVFPALTNREREVLDLVAAGCGNQRDRPPSSPSEKTVRNHVAPSSSNSKPPTVQPPSPWPATPASDSPADHPPGATPPVRGPSNGRC